jgi:hypothetical protein
MARHRHIIGQPATGKTALLFELFQADTSPGRLVIDTKGDLEIDHDFLFDPSVTRWNPLAEPIDPDLAPSFFAQAIKEAFGYDDIATPVMSMYLSFSAAVLIDNGFNLTDAPRLLIDPEFRTQCAHNNPLVRQFWDTFEKLTEREQRGEVASTLNKFIGLLLDGRARRLFGVNRSGLSLGDLADKTMLVRLPVSEYGTDTVTLIGSLLLTYVAQIITTPYSIYIEDAHLFAQGTLIKILSGSIHSLTLSHQYLDQLSKTANDHRLVSAIMGNCAERFIFRVSQADGKILAKDLPPMSSKQFLDELPPYTYRPIPYIKSMPDGRTFPLEK